MADSPVPVAETADFVERRECYSQGILEASTCKSDYSPGNKRRKSSGKSRKRRRTSPELSLCPPPCRREKLVALRAQAARILKALRLTRFRRSIRIPP